MIVLIEKLVDIHKPGPLLQIKSISFRKTEVCQKQTQCSGGRLFYCSLRAMAEFVVVRDVKHYKPRMSTLVRDFKVLYRFEERNVQWLADRFLGASEETRGGALSSVHRIKICLRYLSNPGYQQGIGQELGVSQATVSRTVYAVIDSIIAHSNEWIKFPTTNRERTEAKELWQTKYRFPTAIGAVDCTHIGILKPRLHGDEYINRKGKPTLNVQATCDAKEMFTSVDVSWPGSVHDSRIWRNSQICLELRNKDNAVLLGDNGYGIESCLMTPFRNPTPGAELRYNKLLKKERVIIERCFGQLKRRFPILQYVCRVKLENVPKIIIACVMLHNIAKTLADPDFQAGEEEPEEVEDAAPEENENNDELPLRQQGQQIRRNLSLVINTFNDM